MLKKEYIANYPRIDKNTVIKTKEGPEKNVPHFFVDLSDIRALFEHDFELIRVQHVDSCISKGVVQNNKHYHIWGKLKKKSSEPDFSLSSESKNSLLSCKLRICQRNYCGRRCGAGRLLPR